MKYGTPKKIQIQWSYRNGWMLTGGTSLTCNTPLIKSLNGFFSGFLNIIGFLIIPFSCLLFFFKLVMNAWPRQAYVWMAHMPSCLFLIAYWWFHSFISVFPQIMSMGRAWCCVELAVLLYVYAEKCVSIVCVCSVSIEMLSGLVVVQWVNSSPKV